MLALFLVDLQQDFCENGALAVPDADSIIPMANTLIERFTQVGLPVAACRDCHPDDHCSFAENGGLWPRHCVKGTSGGDWHPQLRLPHNAIILDKAYEPNADAYSPFVHKANLQALTQRHIDQLMIMGLASDFCVKNTALDWHFNGFTAYVVADGCRSVTQAGGQKAFKEMKKAGIHLITLSQGLSMI